MLGLARHSPASTNVFLTFAESGKCEAFLGEVHRHGFQGLALEHNARRMSTRQPARLLRHLRRLRPTFSRVAVTSQT